MMMRKGWIEARHLLGLLLILIISFLTVQSPLLYAKPLWLEEGVYAEYMIRDYLIKTRNGTYIDGRGSVATYRWNVTKMKIGVASIFLSFNEPKKLGFIHLRAEVDVNTRDITMSNGESLGKTLLWIEQDVKEGQSLYLFGKPPNEVTGIVKEPPGDLKTIQGIQRIWALEVTGSIENNSISAKMHFDRNTGLLLVSVGQFVDLTVQLMGVIWIARVMELVLTNVNLGPEPFFLTIKDILIIVTSLVVISVAFILLIRRKRKIR